MVRHSDTTLCDISRHNLKLDDSEDAYLLKLINVPRPVLSPLLFLFYDNELMIFTLPFLIQKSSYLLMTPVYSYMIEI